MGVLGNKKWNRQGVKMEKIYTLKYSIVQGCKNIKRNKMFSLTSISTITACLFLFGIFFFLVSNVQYMIKNMESSVAVTVFFDEGISDSQIANIGNQIETREDVKEVVFVSAEAAWESFKGNIYDEQMDLVDTFAEDNPLADSASYEIYVKDVSMQKQLVSDLEKIDGVRKVNSSDETARVLTTFNGLISVVSFFIIALLISVSVFLISTTVALGISVRKEEIAIMRLIGATDFFVQGPFIVEGIAIGLIGAIVPMGILAVIYYQVIDWISNRFSLLSQWMVFLDIKSEFSILVPICLGIGVGIGLLGSCLTVKKHLRV